MNREEKGKKKELATTLETWNLYINIKVLYYIFAKLSELYFTVTGIIKLDIDRAIITCIITKTLHSYDSTHFYFFYCAPEIAAVGYIPTFLLSLLSFILIF